MRVNIRVIDRGGALHRLEAQSGEALVVALSNANLVEAICGGACSCGTCQVHVDAQWLPALPRMQADEQELIDGLLHSRPESRLACRIELSPLLENLGVRVAPEQ